MSRRRPAPRRRAGPPAPRFRFGSRSIAVRADFPLDFPRRRGTVPDLTVELTGGAMAAAPRAAPLAIAAGRGGAMAVSLYGWARFAARPGARRVRGALPPPTGKWRFAVWRDTLLAPAVEAWLWPRGVFSLHAAAAVDRRGRLALFLGPSGCGKSTAARAWARRTGGRSFSDDRIVVDGDRLYSWPGGKGLPRRRLRWLFAVRHRPRRPARLAPLTAAAAGGRLLAATRFAGCDLRLPAARREALLQAVVPRLFALLPGARAFTLHLPTPRWGPWRHTIGDGG